MNLDPQYLLMFLTALLVSATLHEMMHGYIALKLGDDLAHSQGRISFNPLVHIDPFLTVLMPMVLILLGQSPILAAKPVPINTTRLKWDEFGMALVGIAGPATNFVLAILGAIIFNVTPEILREFLVIFIQINVALCVFNMLPLPPLDGSRVLYAIAPDPVRDIMRQIESFGIFGVVVILLLLGNFIQPILMSGYDFVFSIVNLFV